VQSAWRTRSRQSLLLCAAGCIVILVGMRDWLVVRLGVTGAPTFSLLPHAVFVFVLFMGWIAVDRYSQQVRAYAHLAQSLEVRVAQREAELDASYKQLASQTEEQARLQERQRIMRDIHDGVGSHLVSLLSLARRGEVSSEKLESEINIALDELRVAVDSLQPVHGDLATVLATMRYRLQPRLQAAGLEVEWQVEELPPVPSLTPQRVMQIQRVLLEAFTNVLRHAHATRIRVAARALEEPPRLVLEVEDNGVGFDAGSAAAGGLGVGSMRNRSESIGALLALRSSPGQGTRVTLELPRT
jgi:signal transduction histidine kinase